MKSTSYKWLLIFLLLFSCFFDIWATISDNNFLSLEANFFFNNIYVLIFVKIIFCSGLSFILYRVKPNDAEIKKFFYIHMIILLFFIQMMAGFNNIYIKESIRTNLNENSGDYYADVADIPKEIVKEQFASSPEVSKRQYLGIMATMFYIPFFLALISFGLYRKIG